MNQPWLVTLFDLFLMQLANLRWAWRWILVGGFVIPFTVMFGLYYVLGPQSSEMLLYLVTGNAVVSLLFGTMSQTTARFAYMRETEMLHYLAVLPVSKLALVLATVWGFLFLSLPGVIFTLGVGQVALDLPISFHPLAAVIILLGGTSLAAIGALLGSALPSYQVSGTLSQLLTFGMMIASPIFVSETRLPWFVRPISYLLPSTYVAHGFRATLGGQISQYVFVDIAMLCAFSLIALVFVTRHLDWRD